MSYPSLISFPRPINKTKNWIIKSIACLDLSGFCETRL
jgi:hypothetical protein